MEKLNNRFYGVIGSDYDLFKLSVPHHDELQETVRTAIASYAPENPDQLTIDVVEIGCGTGLTTRRILEVNSRIKVTAIDNDPEMIVCARKELLEFGNRVTFLQMDAISALKSLEKSISFDIAASALTIHNLKDSDRRELAVEISNCIKPRGLFVNADKIAKDNALEHSKDLAQQLKAFEIYLEMNRKDLFDEWTRHYLEDEKIRWTEREAKNLLLQNQFTNIETIFRKNMEATIIARKSAEIVPKRFTPVEKVTWHQNILSIYDQMRKRSKNPYDLEFEGLSLTVLPNVYSPDLFTDTRYFARWVQEIVTEGSLLEIGTGTGAIALFVAKNGIRVVATDLNPEAVKNATINVARNNLDISIREGNMYEPVAGEKFDYIFWSHPFNNSQEPITDPLLQSGFDYKYNGLKEYIAEARDYLNPNGRLLIGTGNTADLDSMKGFAQEYNYDLKVLRETSVSFTYDGKGEIKLMLLEFISRKS